MPQIHYLVNGPRHRWKQQALSSAKSIYLPLLHNWTVCQRKDSPSWSVSMLWSQSFTFKRPPSFTWSDSSRFWFTNYQPGILKKENRKITKTFLLFSTPRHNFAYIIRMRLRIMLTANRKHLKTIIHILLIQCLLCLSSAAPSVIQKPLVLCKNEKIWEGEIVENFKKMSF